MPSPKQKFPDLGKVLDNVSTESAENSKEAEKVDKIKKSKKPVSDFLKIDLKPAGYNLKDYVNKRAAALSSERGCRVGKATYIQELIIADMESAKVKNTKRDKVAKFLEDMDDKKLNALITLFEIQ